MNAMMNECMYVWMNERMYVWMNNYGNRGWFTATKQTLIISFHCNIVVVILLQVNYDFIPAKRCCVIIYSFHFGNPKQKVASYVLFVFVFLLHFISYFFSFSVSLCKIYCLMMANLNLNFNYRARDWQFWIVIGLTSFLSLSTVY